VAQLADAPEFLYGDYSPFTPSGEPLGYSLPTGHYYGGVQTWSPSTTPLEQVSGWTSTGAPILKEGRVLGASTGGGSPTPSQSPQPEQPPQPSGPSPEELALQRAKEGFSAAYQPIYDYLNKVAGYLPEWRQEKERELASLYQAQLGELETAKGAALQKLPGYRQQVRQMKATSLRDLYQQMRNMLQAGGVYLGTMGAADSSAAQAYGALLSKAAMRGSADISKQAMSLMNEINMKEQDIINTFNQQKAQLDTWKAGELAKIGEWYRTKQAAINEAKATASQQERLALAAAEQDLVNQAIARINALDQEARQWDAAMQQWAINTLSELDQLKAIYPELARWQPTGITVPQLKGLAGLGPRESAADWFVNPYARRKREEEERVINWLQR